MNNKREYLIPAILCAAFVLLYSLNARLVTGGDTLAHLYVAASVWNTGDFDFREYEQQLLDHGGGELPYFVVQEEDGRIRTLFSFFPGLLLLPFGPFLEALDAESITGWAWAGKAANSLFTFGSGAILWLLLRRRIPQSLSWFIVAGFWFGTPLWAQSMNYLQHQPAILFQFLALLLLFGQEESETPGPRWHFALAGFFAGLAVLSRYQCLLSIGLLTLLVIWFQRKSPYRIVAFASGGAVPAAGLLTYNAAVAGSVTDIGYVYFPWLNFEMPLQVTLPGLFLNPSRGVLIHSLWLLTGVGGLFLAINNALKREPVAPILAFAAITPWPLIFLYAAFTGWFGGWSWGYRYLMDILPQMTILAAFGAVPLWNSHQLWRGVYAFSVAAAIGVQSVGALMWNNDWHRHHDLGILPHQDWLWQTRFSQPLWYLRRGRVYLGERAISLRTNPFESRGFYEREIWDGKEVAWTGPQGASFYTAVREHPLRFRLMASPGAENTPLDVSILVNGERAVETSLADRNWHTVELSEIPFQHAAVITIQTERTWQEPDGKKRDLGVAVEFPP